MGASYDPSPAPSKPDATLPCDRPEPPLQSQDRPGLPGRPCTARSQPTVSEIADAIEVLEAEAAAIRAIVPLLDEAFVAAVDDCLKCRGRVAVSGMGKAGLIGEKISATLASTGTPSFFLHPAEALHGDLGRLRPEDLVLALSNSGETEEMIRLIDAIRGLGARLIAITGDRESRLARHADRHLDIGRPGEACPMGLAPTSTTTAMLALGDALAMVVLKRRGFSSEDYARFHPGGSLGRKLMKVGEIMRKDGRCTQVGPETSTHGVLVAMNATVGRPGAACVVDTTGRLVGFVSDGDLVRAMGRGPEFLEHPVSEIMVREPKTITADQLVSEATRFLRAYHIDQLPVVDAAGRLEGLLDVQDIIDVRLG
ncbi:MAG: KpsF/GutQ family sugar-phosphate isomerase [Planctomycetes bacterium]|nr:KpsF/GutQ family sugar-phosphate isomerase [Planctomycetota bacterium]